MEDIVPVLFAVFVVIAMIIRGIASLGKKGPEQDDSTRTEEDVVLEDFANRAREMLYGKSAEPTTQPPEFGEFDEPEPGIAPALQEMRATLVDQARRIAEPQIPVARRAPARPAPRRRTAAPVAAKRKKAARPEAIPVTEAPLRRKRRTGKLEHPFKDLEEVRRGIVLAEILGPPKSLR
jgi:hypothetical protein